MSETTEAHAEIPGVLPGDTTGTDAHGAPVHAAAAHDEHGHGTPLGPIDWAAWGAGILGIAAGLAVAACLFIATQT